MKKRTPVSDLMSDGSIAGRRDLWLKARRKRKAANKAAKASRKRNRR